MTKIKNIKLGQVADFRNGVNFSQADEGSGIPILKVKDFGTRHAVPIEGLDELERGRLSVPQNQMLVPNDIVIIRSNGNRELVGRSLIYVGPPNKITFSGFCIRARVDRNRALPSYVHYWLRSPLARQIFSREGNGTGIQNISQSFLSDLAVPLPSLDAQALVVEVLGSLDDKIELNRRMNETLEAMAQAIFRDWFVDFGPTRRKMDGASDPVTIMGGLVTNPVRARELAELFPARLGDNGLPEGWEERGLDQIADFLNGLALQKFSAGDEADSLPVIKIAELRNGITSKSNRASRNLPEKYIVRDGDFLFSWSGSLLARFWTEGEGALNQHLFKVSSAEYPPWFYSLWVHHHMDEFRQIAASKATTMGHIQRSHLASAKVVCPPAVQLSGMSILLGPLIERTKHNDFENRTIAATRDLLLPKLMSGEIRLREAEAELEAAQ